MDQKAPKGNREDKIRKILVIQTAKLGDMVCTTPVFRAIKNSYPQAQVFVCGDAINEDVLEGNPNVDGYIKREDLNIRLLRKIKFDAAVLLNPNPRVLLKLLLARVSKIIAVRVEGGFSPFMTLSYRLLLRLVESVPHRFNHYAPQEYLNNLKPLGITSTDTRKELFFSREAEEKVRHIIASQKGLKIAISPSAGNKIKNWGGKKFAKLIDEIYKEWKPFIYLIGGPRDREEVRETLENLSPETKAVDFSSKLNIDELKAFISLMDLFISVDTGPIYIAEAFNIATIDILGPMNGEEQPPRGPKHRNVSARRAGEEPVLHIMNARVYDVAEARRQVDAIMPETVFATCEELLHSLKYGE